MPKPVEDFVSPEELRTLKMDDFWAEWWDFLQKNWMWYLPIVATLAAPLIGSGAGALWDYMKMKKMV